MNPDSTYEKYIETLFGFAKMVEIADFETCGNSLAPLKAS
jgi:hypothetical protein